MELSVLKPPKSKSPGMNEFTSNAEEAAGSEEAPERGKEKVVGRAEWVDTESREGRAQSKT